MAANYMSAGTEAAIQTAWEAKAPFVGFHTASPGTIGTNESGIARVALGLAGHTATAGLTVPGGTTITTDLDVPQEYVPVWPYLWRCSCHLRCHSFAHGASGTGIDTPRRGGRR
jgi:hypothetical protein